MSRSSKVFIGLLSFLPIILFAGFFITVFLPVINPPSWEDREPGGSGFFGFMEYILLIGVALLLVTIGILVYLIVHVSRHKTMEPTERAIWILVFVLGGFISYPIYWYMRIWKEDQ